MQNLRGTVDGAFAAYPAACLWQQEHGCSAQAGEQQCDPVQAGRGGGPKADVDRHEAKRRARASAKQERLARREREKLVRASSGGNKGLGRPVCAMGPVFDDVATVSGCWVGGSACPAGGSSAVLP